tara:strand:+ start:810 stop:2780 length:1971 start_codon:yes stop_codon:yes gene_type:complete
MILVKLNLSSLNDDQLKVVTAEKGKHLVLAGAGTGKTRTLTYRTAYLIEKGMSPENMLLLTFTNKAARNMMFQASSLISGNRGRINGGTFHSIANRYLRTHGKLIGLDNNFSIIDSEDQRDLVKATVAETLGKLDHYFPTPRVLIEMFSNSINKNQDLEDVVVQNSPQSFEYMKEIFDVYAAYTKRKWNANCLDYDDLLICWHRLLADFSEESKELFFHEDILVDEFQDTNKIQGEIVDLLANVNGGKLTVVGDDCQSIFAFRGAVYENILEFKDRHEDVKIHYLKRNYRSTSQVLNLANDIIKNNKKQFYKELVPASKSVGPRPKIMPLPNVNAEATWVAKKIAERFQDGFRLSEMAVLYRNHSHSAFLQAELVKRNIPYQIRSGVRFLEQAHIKDVVAHLKILINSKDEIAWTRVIGMCPGIGAVRSRKLIKEILKSKNIADLGQDFGKDLLPEKAYRNWVIFFNEILSLSSLNHQEYSTAKDLIVKIMESSYSDYLQVKYKNASNREDDINQLAQLSDSYKSLKSFISDFVLLGEMFGSDVVAGTDKGERLILSTIHQSKGLEWDMVWIIRACDSSFCGPRTVSNDDIEEERRVFYVAVTRAKRFLTFTYPIIANEWGGANTKFQGSDMNKPCRFLLEGNDSLDKPFRSSFIY